MAGGQRVGYIRVSSLGQNPDRQLEGVEVDRVFTDTVSGKSVERPALSALLGFVRDGDVVMVHSMDRLARNLDDLRRLVRELTGRGVCVQFVKEQLRFGIEDSPMAALLLSVLGAFAEFERALIRECPQEGIALAKATWRLPGPQAIPHLRPGPTAAYSCQGRRTQGQPGPGAGHQPPNSLPVPTPAATGTAGRARMT